MFVYDPVIMNTKEFKYDLTSLRTFLEKKVTKQYHKIIHDAFKKDPAHFLFLCHMIVPNQYLKKKRRNKSSITFQEFERIIKTYYPYAYDILTKAYQGYDKDEQFSFKPFKEARYTSRMVISELSRRMYIDMITNYYHIVLPILELFGNMYTEWNNEIFYNSLNIDRSKYQLEFYNMLQQEMFDHLLSNSCNTESKKLKLYTDFKFSLNTLNIKEDTNINYIRELYRFYEILTYSHVNTFFNTIRNTLKDSPLIAVKERESQRLESLIFITDIFHDYADVKIFYKRFYVNDKIFIYHLLSTQLGKNTSNWQLYFDCIQFSNALDILPNCILKRTNDILKKYTSLNIPMFDIEPDVYVYVSLYSIIYFTETVNKILKQNSIDDIVTFGQPIIHYGTNMFELNHRFYIDKDGALKITFHKFGSSKYAYDISVAFKFTKNDAQFEIGAEWLDKYIQFSEQEKEVIEYYKELLTLTCNNCKLIYTHFSNIFLEIDKNFKKYIESKLPPITLTDDIDKFIVELSYYYGFVPDKFFNHVITQENFPLVQHEFYLHSLDTIKKKFFPADL